MPLIGTGAGRGRKGTRTVDVLPDLHLWHAQRRAQHRRRQVAPAAAERRDRACAGAS